MHDNPRPRARTHLRRLAGIAALTFVLAACGTTGSSSQAANDGKTVTMSGSSFGVTEITVPVGDVSFVNDDGVTHQPAEGENGTEAGSPRITATSVAGGETKAIAFSAAGDYNVTCLIHGSMNMVVHVE